MTLGSDTRFRGLACVVLLLACGARTQCDAEDAGTEWREQLSFQGRHAQVQRTPLAAGTSSYLFTVADGAAATRTRTVQERLGQSSLRTGNTLFDGLYALALEDAALDSVAQIRDGAFDHGRPIDCQCFETGERWPYVWTRDISYSVDLGLAWLDPLRARNSLLFKQSAIRSGLARPGMAATRLVAQDTGSGGSWPVSTDRVVWIHAALDTLSQLPPAQAREFEPQLWRVATATLAQDRRMVFDPRRGLYRGETSFLDWREQTYPQWTRSDTLFIAESYALSTNVLHYVALLDTAQLARRRHPGRAAGFARQARQLRAVINRAFWREGAGLYASYLLPGVHPSAASAYDLLGLAWAVTYGVADARQARLILQHYPLTEAGPPVIWPEQQGVPIYHNRALWPFVTAYALQAARQARHAEVATRAAESLIRGSALSLSNMENFEFLTQQSAFEDGALSGPVITSPRQLWSVAGYLNMVVSGIFGVAADMNGVRIAPAVPGRLAHELFAGQRTLSLRDWGHGARRWTVSLDLPASWSDSQWLEAAAPVRRGWTPRRGARAPEIRMQLVARDAPPQALTLLSVADAHALSDAERRRLFAPREPRIDAVERTGNSIRVQVSNIETDSAVQVYRDGKPIAEDAGPALLDDAAATASPGAAGAAPGPCYHATQRYRDTGLTSLPSRVQCLAAAPYALRIAAGDGALVSPDRHPLSRSADRPMFAEWGGPAQSLRWRYTAPADGLQRLRIEYANAHGPINTGITAAVKQVVARCRGMAEQAGSIVMPQRRDWQDYGWSSAFIFSARGGQACTLQLRDGFNMSYLEHFRLYTGGQGGATGALNRVNVLALQAEWAGTD